MLGAWLTRTSLLGRLLVVTGLVLLLSYPVIAWLFVASEVRLYRSLIANQTQIALQVLATSLGEQSAVGNYKAIEKMLQLRVLHGPYIALTYRDRDGAQVAAHTPVLVRESPAWFRHLVNLPEQQINQEVRLEGRHYGELQATVDHNQFLNRAWQDLWHQFAIFTGAILALFGAIAFTLPSGMRPLLAATRLARHLKRGDAGSAQLLPAHMAPEIRETIETFNAAANREAWLADFAEITARRTTRSRRMHDVLHLICDRTGLDAACLSYRESDGLLQVPAVYARSRRPDVNAWKTLADEVALRGRMVRDVLEDKRIDQAAYYLGLPAPIDSDVNAVLSFIHYGQMPKISRSQLELVELCAQWLGGVLSAELRERVMYDQKERVEAVLNNVLEGIVTFDEDLRILAFNPAAERIFGHSAADVVGTALCNLFPKSLSGIGGCDFSLEIEKLTASGVRQGFGVRADRSEFPLEISISGLRAKRERLYVAVVRDVTERLAAEQALRRSEARLRRAQRVAQMGEWEYAPTRNELVWSKELYEIVGLAPQQVMSFERLLSMTHADDRERLRGATQQAVSQGANLEGEFRINRSDGQLRYVSLFAEPSFDEQGKRTSLFGVLQDITERKQAELKAHSALLDKLRAEARDRSKNEFLANMSHELRTPLNAIIGYSEILSEGAAQAGQADTLADAQKIQSAGRHLLSLINEILDFSKIEAGRMELHLERFAIATLVREVSAMLKPLLLQNGNRFNLRIDPQMAEMQADMSKLRQMLFNLLGNACKFTQGGEINLDVEKLQRDNRTWIVLRISDTGIGISAEQQQKLFAPFTQVNSSTTRKYGGTGLGLAISRRYCQMMGGDITVESELDKGATFSIILPQEPAPAENQNSALFAAPAARKAVGE